MIQITIYCKKTFISYFWSPSKLKCYLIFRSIYLSTKSKSKWYMIIWLVCNHLFLPLFEAFVSWLEHEYGNWWNKKKFSINEVWSFLNGEKKWMRKDHSQRFITQNKYLDYAHKFQKSKGEILHISVALSLIRFLFKFKWM